MPFSPPLLVGSTLVTVAAIIIELLSTWGIIQHGMWIAPLVFAFAITLWVANATFHPAVLLLSFLIFAVLFEGIQYMNWFGLQGVIP